MTKMGNRKQTTIKKKLYDTMMGHYDMMTIEKISQQVIAQLTNIAELQFDMFKNSERLFIPYLHVIADKDEMYMQINAMGELPTYFHKFTWRIALKNNMNVFKSRKDECVCFNVNIKRGDLYDEKVGSQSSK